MKWKVLLALAISLHSFYAKSQMNIENFYNNPTWHESQTQMKNAQVLSFEKETHPVRYISDVCYANENGTALTLQILQPDVVGATKPYPCVVYVQGSAWMKQDVYANLPVLAKFAERGYVVAIVEYRHSGIAAFPAPLQDVKSAIRFMRKNAETYHVDAENLFVWGDSSGGHLSLMTALTGSMPKFDSDLYPEVSTRINACVAYYGISDIKSVHTDPCSASSGLADSPEGMLLGRVDIDTHIAEADEASPITYVDKDKSIPPIMLAVGTHDHIVPFSQSELMANTLEKAGKEYAYYVLEGADHGSWEFWTPEMFDKVESFLKKYMK